MPERITSKDIKDTAQALEDCAKDITYLLRTTPVGCPCPVIEGDNYSYVDYKDGCVHHGQFKRMLEENKRCYEEAERKLANTLRTQFAQAALTGAAYSDKPHEEVVRRAFRIADEAIASLSKPS